MRNPIIQNLVLVAGARPNFMKIAPLVRLLNQRNQIDQKNPVNYIVVHTSQHYDLEMSEAFFRDLELPLPDVYLGVGSGTHAEQTARIMIEFEKVCLEEKPDVVVVVGDVNSTLACALVAAKLCIPVAHVEAGLRSYDRTMPEEINRMVTDLLSDYLFVSEKSGIENLKKEGKNEGSIFFVGNTMIDTLFYHLSRLNDSTTYRRPDVDYAVLTLHRPNNVDPEEKLREIMGAIAEIARELPIYFPVHPRTRGRMEAIGLVKKFNGHQVNLLPPLPYRSFLCLYKDAKLVLTDSGGIQEETTALGIPCFTIRENTERPVTIEEGTNTLVGTTAKGILSAFDKFRKGETKKGRIPELWDGRASERIIDILLGGRAE